MHKTWEKTCYWMNMIQFQRWSYSWTVVWNECERSKCLQMSCVFCVIFFGNDDSVDDNDGTAVDELISKFGLANTTHTLYSWLLF